MNLIAAWRARMAKTDRAEFEAAWLRVVIAVVVALYVFAYPKTGNVDMSDGSKTVLIAISIWTLAALALFLAPLSWPTVSPVRRVLSMILDVGMLTYFLCSMGESGVSIVLLYLFIIFSHGFRYGHRYLLTAEAASLVAFVLVILFSPWWSQNKAYAIGWLIAIAILPMYVGKLAERMRAALVQRDEALRECLARVGSGD